MNRVVGPRDCALAIALPLTKQQFLSQLQAEHEHDYASYIRSLHLAKGANDDYYWNVVYEPFAAVMSETLNAIEKCDINIVRDATLEDFRRLTTMFPVVTLVSHWRFRALQAEEIVDLNAVLHAMENPVGSLAVAYRDALLRADASALCAEVTKSELAAALNKILQEGHAAYAAEERTPVMLMNVPAQRLTRATLERAFSGAIVPGRAIEFADGMKTIPEVIAALPPAYDAFLDMTICNSAIVGEEIKAERPQCTVAVNRYPTEPHIRLALYRRFACSLRKNPGEIRQVMARFGEPT